VRRKAKELSSVQEDASLTGSWRALYQVFSANREILYRRKLVLVEFTPAAPQ
jgi:hypothetical protein